MHRDLLVLPMLVHAQAHSFMFTVCTILPFLDALNLHKHNVKERNIKKSNWQVLTCDFSVYDATEPFGLKSEHLQMIWSVSTHSLWFNKKAAAFFCRPPERRSILLQQVTKQNLVIFSKIYSHTSLCKINMFPLSVFFFFLLTDC